jgi:hypothetical protein
LPFDATLSSDVFPLAAPVEVRLALTYRYGLENAYDLTIRPVGANGAPFALLRASWSRRGQSISVVPDFPTPRPWGPPAPDTDENW